MKRWVNVLRRTFHPACSKQLSRQSAGSFNLLCDSLCIECTEFSVSDEGHAFEHVSLSLSVQLPISPLGSSLDFSSHTGFRPYLCPALPTCSKCCITIKASPNWPHWDQIDVFLYSLTPHPSRSFSAVNHINQLTWFAFSFGDILHQSNHFCDNSMINTLEVAYQLENEQMQRKWYVARLCWQAPAH